MAHVARARDLLTYFDVYDVCAHPVSMRMRITL